MSMINQVLFHIGKSRNLQKLLRYFSGIGILTFKPGATGCGGRGGRGGCSGWYRCAFCGGCGGNSGLSGLHGVFLTIFVFYLNDLPSEALSSTSSVSSL